MMSLVVPGISLTIDVFNFVSALIKLLFPTFGLPIIATVNPSFIKEDNFAELMEFLILFCTSLNFFWKRLDNSIGISSSEKSIRDSINEDM